MKLLIEYLPPSSCCTPIYTIFLLYDSLMWAVGFNIAVIMWDPPSPV